MTKISAKIIADSLFNGVRLTSIQLEYHRFVLPELNTHRVFSQPPSGGCVLKQLKGKYHENWFNQPPSGGCVLKLILMKRVYIKCAPYFYGGFSHMTLINNRNL